MSLHFEIESEGKTKKSPKLSTPEICICLNRYGLVSKTEERVGTEVFPDKSLLHQINFYAYCRRYLRNGYIYVFNETKGTVNEYVTKDGKYYEILKNKKEVSEDERDFDLNGKYQFFITEKQGSVLWLIYSHVQWTAQYIMKYINDDDGFRTIRGQRFETQKIVAKDLGYIGTTKIYFKPVSTNEGIEEGNPESELRAEYRFTEILADRRYREVEKETAKMKKELKKYMVTFSLHDPIGCADDLVDDYARLREYHAAFSQGLLYAKTAEEMLANKKNPSFINLEDKATQQYVALNRSTSIINDMILKSGQYSGYYLDFNRLAVERVLGLKERNDIFEKLRDTHLTLYVVLNSNYYQNALIDIYFAPLSELPSGQRSIITHHQHFAVYPRYLEYDKLLAYHKEEWDNYLYNSYFYGGGKRQEPKIRAGGEVQYVVRELLNIDLRKTNFHEYMESKAPEWISKGKDFFLNLDTSFGLYLFFAKDVDKKQLMDNANSLFSKRDNLVRLRNEDISKIIENAKKIRDEITNKNYSFSEWVRRFVFGKRSVLEKRAEQRQAVSEIAKRRVTGVERRAAVSLNKIDRQVSDVQMQILEVDARIDKLKWVDSRLFRGFLGTLSIANLVFASKDFAKQSNKDAVDYMRFVGSIVETSSVIMSIAISEERNKALLDMFVRGTRFETRIVYGFTLATRVGLGATAILSVATIWEGRQILNRNDYAGGWTTIASGITGLAAAITLWCSYSLSLVVLGPIGIFLLFTSFILALIASYTVKNETARFLKASVYGKGFFIGNRTTITDSMSPTKAMEKLYNKGKPKATEFVDDNDYIYDMTNFRTMLRYLFDKMGCYTASFQTNSLHTANNFHIIDAFEITCQFNAMLSFTELEYAMQVSYADEAYLIEQNIVYLDTAYVPIIDNEEGYITIRLKFELNSILEQSNIAAIGLQQNPQYNNYYYTTDQNPNQIKIENMKKPSSPNSSDPNMGMGMGRDRLKRFCFMFRIVDRQSGMDIPLSAESDNPLYYVMQGNLYSPDNDTYNFTQPQIRYTQLTKKELYLN